MTTTLAGRARPVLRALQATAGVAVLLLGVSSAQAEAPPFKVCVLVHNAPYAMQAQAPGFDLDTAAAVAQKLQRPLEPVWTNNEPEITEIDDSDFPVRKLVRGQCDAIFSMPGPAATTLGQDPKLALGAPYYGAAFELVGCGGEVPPQMRAR